MKQKTIKKHEQEYIHIRKPNKEKVGSFFLGLFLLTLSYFNLKLIIYKWKDLGLDILGNCETNCNQYSSWIQLDIIPNLLIEYGLILFGIISLFYLWKIIDLDSLIIGLIAGLIPGLIIGLIAGLIPGLIFGLIFGLIAGLIGGLIAGLILGLIINLEDNK